MSQRVEVVACAERDVLWLYHCEGCFEPFPDAATREAHVAMCVAYRNVLIEELVDRQAREDDERAARRDGSIWSGGAA